MVIRGSNAAVVIAVRHHLMGLLLELGIEMIIGLTEWAKLKAKNLFLSHLENENIHHYLLLVFLISISSELSQYG